MRQHVRPRSLAENDPIVFTGVGDPVGTGVVPSLSHPRGNNSRDGGEGKARLEILKGIDPNTAPVAVLWNDTNPGMALRACEAQSSSDKLGLNLESIGVHDLISFDAAFAKINSSQFNALLTLVDPFTHEHRQRIIDFAAKRLLPAMYESREFVHGGGLASYGPNLPALQRRAADCISMIFKSSKPGDIPVEQPSI